LKCLQEEGQGGTRESLGGERVYGEDKVDPQKKKNNEWAKEKRTPAHVLGDRIPGKAENNLFRNLQQSLGRKKKQSLRKIRVGITT